MIPVIRRTFVDEILIESGDAGSAAEPFIEVYRNSASPADDDKLGAVKFTGESDTGSKVEYGRLVISGVDVSNGSEDGKLHILLMRDGTLTDVASVNDNGLLSLDSGITAKGATYNLGDTSVSVTIRVATGGNNLIVRNDQTDKKFKIDYPTGSSGYLEIRSHDGSSGTTRTTWDQNGVLVHNTGDTSTGDVQFRGETDADLFTVDASADRVGISVGTGSARHTLDVRGSLGYPVLSRTSDYTLTDADHVIYGDASSSDVTITLPTWTKGRVYEVYRADSGGMNDLSVAAPSSVQINGSTSALTIANQFDGLRLIAIDSTDGWIATDFGAASGGGAP